MSAFSTFIRLATDEERIEVYRTVLAAATAKQRAQIGKLPAQAMRVGPNTDAVVWKLCDTNETVEL